MYGAPDSTTVHVEPLVRPLERSMSQRDYDHLQQLIQREKQRREEKLREQLQQQYALQEQKRMELALYRLAYLQARERQQREEQIQRAIQAYRQKQLIRAVEEQVYRQKIAAALEQQQQELMRRRYLQHLRAQLAQRRQDSPRPVLYQSEPCFDDYKQQHMCQVLRHVFGEEPEKQETVEDDGDPDWVDEPDEEQALESLWDRMTLASEDDEDEDDEPSPSYQQLQQQSRQLPQQQQLIGEQHQRSMGSSETTTPSAPALSISSSPSATFTRSPADTNMADYSQEEQREEEERQQEALATLLRQLVQKRQDEQLMESDGQGEQFMEGRETQPEKELVTPAKEEKATPLGGFIPQTVMTEAEPTPASELSPATLGGDTPVPADERSSSDQDQVDETEKQAQLTKLDYIERKLKDIQATHQSQPLGPLTIDKALKTLPATTKANKEFLKREEELVQLLLQLDSIESFGLDEIRQRRKDAVHTAEKLLQSLDDYKSTSL
ncbi:hypothetical protein INT43_006112 [Umbelopsis isabellina]|uniref:BAG domain-containing protein n=1 Tax=Mortierella isabellina TaxID=91625 RepID=A0A8H7PJV7_MORIS|nr:hypothetical protein INT43_006112 [Umbelopsis isabellina]